ncbi:DsbA family oxidoreductase [Paraburkholderia edwinii]|jgi:predicted DsbA family dithiol-disulfide isomerase|uniref:DsbA family oxidoreductase n=1 Tax=Paraburkholderia edwinii TaxID=2861782 RepID=A0ABX8UGU2_9BURK|nr:DsbA family oxidoreductase [Paraburkholderia edwinii]QYD68121.1 DsbA family oxidoreductase [Paraburkholderia edwinii]
MTPLRIDYISDIACPWCAVGLASLQQALANLNDEVRAEWVMHPFELNPQMGPEGQNIVEYLGNKYGRTPAQIAETQAVIRERGASVGFAFGERKFVYNTFDAHRLLQWAGEEDKQQGEQPGKQLALEKALMQAYHGNGNDVSDHDVLVEAARSVGLDAQEARRILQSDDYADAVRADEQETQAMGIHSVPAIIFNRRYLVSGGQPVEAFEQALRQILAEEKA